MSETTTPVQVGQNVPDFDLTCFDPKSGDFTKYSLAESKKNGKWTLLVFYPADFTFVCATEFQSLGEKYAKLKEAGVEVVTVSTDTQFTHLAWQRHEGQLKDVKYLMGADTCGSLARSLGVLLPIGLALRGTFLIDPQGKLVMSEVNFLNVGRNMDELERKVAAFQYVAKHGDEVCPAKWSKAGDKTLKPGAHLVGKVDEALKS
jgi:alkyl hydroperoxide reductase subunit AhpC